MIETQRMVKWVLSRIVELQKLFIKMREQRSTELDDILVSELKRRIDMFIEQEETRDRIIKQLERLQE